MREWIIPIPASQDMLAPSPPSAIYPTIRTEVAVPHLRDVMLRPGYMGGIFVNGPHHIVVEIRWHAAAKAPHSYHRTLIALWKLAEEEMTKRGW